MEKDQSETSEGGVSNKSTSLRKREALHKQAEEAVQRYELLSRHSRDIILFMRRDDGRILEANAAAVSAYGYAHEELLARSIHDLRAPETRALTTDQMGKADHQGTLFETLHQRKDGSTFPVEVSSQGATIGATRTLISVIRDITARKAAEEAQRQSEEFFRTTFEYASVGMAIGAPDETFARTNAAFDRMLRYEPGELTGVHWSAVTPPDEAAQDKDRYRRFVKSGKPNIAFEKRYVRKDGRVIWADVNVSLVRDAGGKARFAIAMVQDITDRKRAEEALQESEARFRTLAEAALEGIAITEHGRVVDANDQLLRIMGGTRAELIGQEVATLVAPEDRDRVMASIVGGLESHIEHRMFRRDGTPLIVETHGRIIPYQGRQVRITAIRDITEQKMMEEELHKSHDELERRVQERTSELSQAYEKLAAEMAERTRVEEQLRQAHKMEALGRLSGGIAHDFNNILAIIMGFTELVKENLPKGSPEEHRLQMVVEAGLRGREVIRQMLTFSHQMPREKKPLQLSGIVNDTLKLLRASIPSTISIRSKVETQPGSVLGDPVEMQQVLMNLCTNAAHAMRDKGGTLDVELSDYRVPPANARACSMEPGLYTRLVVLDTGVGIAPEIRDKIFDPYFTTKKVGEGSGLGLSTVMGIVKHAHGSITVESAPDKGSTFTVCLPQVGETAMINEVVNVEPIPRGSERILFVDDEVLIVMMGEGLLRQLGYEVTSKTSSREALEVFRNDPFRFDLVITDQTMPEMTGVELAKQILAVRPEVPVILCTGFSYLVNDDSAKTAGIKGFAMKPLTEGEIARIIRQVLDR